MRFPHPTDSKIKPSLFTGCHAACVSSRLPTLLDSLLEEWHVTDRVSRNVGNQLSTYAAYRPRRAKAWTIVRRSLKTDSKTLGKFFRTWFFREAPVRTWTCFYYFHPTVTLRFLRKFSDGSLIVKLFSPRQGSQRPAHPSPAKSLYRPPPHWSYFNYRMCSGSWPKNLISNVCRSGPLGLIKFAHRNVQYTPTSGHVTIKWSFKFKYHILFLLWKVLNILHGVLILLEINYSYCLA
jgi:hypothetical protein